MNLAILAKITAGGMLAGVLAGCVSAAVEVQVLDENTARSTISMIIPAKTYEERAAQGPVDGICGEAELVAAPDGGVTCVTVVEGGFDELRSADANLSIQSLGDGLVRVGFLLAELEDTDSSSPEAVNETRAIFEGQTLSLSVRGGVIVETNMERAADGQSAALTIPISNVFVGDLGEIREPFAVVDIN